MDDADASRATIQRSVGMPADAATVRGLMQDLAVNGWAVMPQPSLQPPTVRVEDVGAGASQVHVSLEVPPGQEQSTGESVDAALADLKQMVLRRTSDAS